MKPVSFPMLFTLLLLSIVWAPPALLAQDHHHCGTMEYNKRHHTARFEQWLQRKIGQKQARVQATHDEGEIYRIPVVVHVVHQGEPVGNESNISFEQIADQIRILNEDFRRLNADTVNTSEIFRPVAADSRIEFVLARQDPQGLATNGVVRVEGRSEGYGINDPALLGTLTQWDPNLYMNVWVTTIAGAGFLGYAELPISDLPGLDEEPNNPLRDGIVIDYRNFGSISTGVLRNANRFGRTATHEVGHYLGLRHIWGDGGCGVDDFVEDTPEQEADYPGCPIEPESCGSRDMSENYMDYTNDNCMNIFTGGQKLRMRTVLENSPRRQTLLNSPGLEAPVPVLNNASITQVVSPKASVCDGSIIPSITVRNTGQNNINSLLAEVRVQGVIVSETEFTLDLAPEATQELTFSALPSELSLVPGTVYEASFNITKVNRTDDENAFGNQETVSFFIPQRDEIPLVEEFRAGGSDSFYDKSVIINPDDQTTWALRDTPSDTDPSNRSLFINFFEYEVQGERDFLYGPTVDLSSLSTATASFKVAYAPFADANFDTSQDGLLVGISTDCGASIDNIVYRKFGEELATDSVTDNVFVPTTAADWREEVISLDAYLGEPNVQLVFIGVNDYGNNLYLDDIEFFVTEYDLLQPAENSFSIEPNPIKNNQLEIEFNLPEQDDVTVGIYSAGGKLLSEYLVPSVLNQTYTFNLAGAPAGVYLVRAVSPTLNDAQRFTLY